MFADAQGRYNLETIAPANTRGARATFTSGCGRRVAAF